MAAPAAHHNQDGSTPLDLHHLLVPPQTHQADRPAASGPTGLEGTSVGLRQTPAPSLAPRKLSRTRNHPSRRVFVASNEIGGQDTGGLVVLGEPVTMEELRWERAKFIKRRTRRWRTVKEGLGFIVLSWAIYQTIRYFVAYSGELSPQMAAEQLTLVNSTTLVYNEDTIRTRFAFALGLLSGLSTALFITHKVFDYLVGSLNSATHSEPLTLTRLYTTIQPRDRTFIKRLLFFTAYLPSTCIIATALVNTILVPIWRYGTPLDPFSIAHSLQGRCSWDVDIIWTGTGNRCRQHPTPYGAFVAAAVTRTVLTTCFLVAFHFAQRQHAIAARSRRSYSATRLMGGKAESALHPSTSRLSSAPTVDTTSPNLPPVQRVMSSPIATPSPVLSPVPVTTPPSSYLYAKSPLPVVPEMAEVESSPIEFARRSILGGPRWPDDPNVIDESPEQTPGSEQPPPTSPAPVMRTASPGTSPHIDGRGYFGRQGRETPSDASESADDEATWPDFRGLMQSLAADAPGASHLSEVQQRVLAQLQAMGAPVNPTDLWNREIPIMGGVVRRMSTIESLGSREHAPDGAGDSGFAGTSSSPSPVETRGRPPSRSGTATTGSTATSGSTGSRQNTRAGTGDSRVFEARNGEPRSDS
jgi:hypothetical protein